MTVTRETPCPTDANWQPVSVESNRVDWFDGLCPQCFPEDWDSVDDRGVETFLASARDGRLLHRSVDTGEECDTSGLGGGKDEASLAHKLRSGKVQVDHEFDSDGEEVA